MCNSQADHAVTRCITSLQFGVRFSDISGMIFDYKAGLKPPERMEHYLHSREECHVLEVSEKEH